MYETVYENGVRGACACVCICNAVYCAVERLVDVTQPVIHDQSALKYGTIDPFKQRACEVQARKRRAL